MHMCSKYDDTKLQKTINSFLVKRLLVPEALVSQFIAMAPELVDGAMAPELVDGTR